MKKLKDQLKTVAKSLATLSKQVEKISKQIDNLQPVKTTSTKKAAPAPKKKMVVKKKIVAKKPPVLETVLKVVKRSKKGITIASLKEKTGLDSRQISNALYKLSKKGAIETKARGLYVIK
jgi:predicted Rossmann fold nucleotide-binding protein DprA/Smf involved in DNA uptake